MPTLRVNNANLYYEIHGDGPETIFFSHGLLWSTRLYDPQFAYFKSRYRCIAYDHRGQGRSEVTESGYDMDTLYEDAVGLIEELGAAPCHFVGLSMGGFVGMRVAARRPDLLKSLILLETSADIEPNVFKYNLLNIIVRLFGVNIVTSQVMPIMFGKEFMTNPERGDERAYWKKELQSNKRTIVRAVQGVINRKGMLDEIGKIRLPTLIGVGNQDVATVPAKSDQIHSKIQHAQRVMFTGAGHSSTVEQPEQVNAAIEAFLKGLG